MSGLWRRVRAPAPAPRAAAIAIAAAIACFTPRPSRASGLDAPVVGTGQSGPVTRDAAAVHWNPAQLGFLTRPELLVGAGVVIGDIRYRRDRRGTYQTPDMLEFKLPLSEGAVDRSKTGPAAQVS